MAEPDKTYNDVLDALEGFASTALDDAFDRAWLRSLRQQAAFGYRRLIDEAVSLGMDAALLEVGGGPYVLSMLFAARGFEVVTLEPRGLGFEQLYRIQDMVLSFCNRENIRFEVLDRRIEDFNKRDAFDLAFSVNVFEHIDDVEAGLRNTVAALRPSGALRVLCANYNFPYEPHFGIPILGNKAFTQKVFSARIERLEEAKKSEGLWRSLNFISVRQVRAICACNGWAVAFDPSTTLDILRRFQFDESLRQRHAPLAPIVDFALKVGIGGLISAFPAVVHPYMDARISRPNA